MAREETKRWFQHLSVREESPREWPKSHSVRNYEIVPGEGWGAETERAVRGRQQRVTVRPREEVRLQTKIEGSERV